MSDCPHEIWERESDVTADGSCPICLRAEVERLKAKIAYVHQRSQRACEILNEFDNIRAALEPKP